MQTNNTQFKQRFKKKRVVEILFGWNSIVDAQVDSITFRFELEFSMKNITVGGASEQRTK